MFCYVYFEYIGFYIYSCPEFSYVLICMCSDAFLDMLLVFNLLQKKVSEKGFILVAGVALFPTKNAVIIGKVK